MENVTRSGLLKMPSYFPMLFLTWLLPGITYLLSSILRILNAWHLSSVCVNRVNPNQKCRDQFFHNQKCRDQFFHNQSSRDQFPAVIKKNFAFGVESFALGVTNAIATSINIDILVHQLRGMESLFYAGSVGGSLF